jgi:hypothetical protein
MPLRWQALDSANCWMSLWLDIQLWTTAVRISLGKDYLVHQRLCCRHQAHSVQFIEFFYSINHCITFHKCYSKANHISTMSNSRILSQFWLSISLHAILLNFLQTNYDLECTKICAPKFHREVLANSLYHLISSYIFQSLKFNSNLINLTKYFRITGVFFLHHDHLLYLCESVVHTNT